MITMKRCNRRLQSQILVLGCCLGGIGVENTGTEIAISLNNMDASWEYILKLKHEMQEQCTEVSTHTSNTW